MSEGNVWANVDRILGEGMSSLRAASGDHQKAIKMVIEKEKGMLDAVEKLHNLCTKAPGGSDTDTDFRRGAEAMMTLAEVDMQEAVTQEHSRGQQLANALAAYHEALSNANSVGGETT